MCYDDDLQLLLDVNFNKIEGATVYACHGNNGILTGDPKEKKAESYDGTSALHFSNRAEGLPARQYVDFGRIPLGLEDITIQIWMKSQRDGCNGWSWQTRAVDDQAVVNISQLTEMQRSRGGVIFSNADFSTPFGSGVTLASMQQYLYFTTSLCAEGAGQPIRMSGLKKANDDRWHQISVTFDRDGTQRVYLDVELLREADISIFQGCSLDGGHFILGADTTRRSGLGEVTIGELHLYRGVMGEEHVRQSYYSRAVIALLREYGRLDLDRDGPKKRNLLAGNRDDQLFW